MTDKNTNNKEEKYKKYSKILIASKNIILHGAPGTGKTYLAKQIAADIVSDGEADNYDELKDELKNRIGFVQFHPGYDYSDFVEGLRPTINEEDSKEGSDEDSIKGSVGFELRPGVFKKFVEDARNPLKADLIKFLEDNSGVKKDGADDEKYTICRKGSSNSEETTFKTISDSKPSKFNIAFNKSNGNIYTYTPANKKSSRGNTLDFSILLELLTCGKTITPKYIDDKYFSSHRRESSYYTALCNEFIEKNPDYKEIAQEPKEIAHVFIIDEINRGEISKIFGELFFSIDPGYRGPEGAVSTQYANMHPDEKFYIPENVYIIGTMNDIDRSVESFDFAMRRRFRFIELKADEHTEMLDALDNKEDAIAHKKDAIAHMEALNNAIVDVDGLDESYQIGAAYFLKLNDISSADPFGTLWEDYLEPLLKDYIRGMYDEKTEFEKLRKAYESAETANVSEGDQKGQQDSDANDTDADTTD